MPPSLVTSLAALDGPRPKMVRSMQRKYPCAVLEWRGDSGRRLHHLVAPPFTGRVQIDSLPGPREPGGRGDER
jgi:hypothetical protein